MTTIVTRAGKGSPLTHTEVDTNFTNLNTAKLETAAIPLGTAAAPSISFLSDANTGIYSPGADTVAFVTAGSNRVHITSAGLVGIGTSGPTKALEIAAGATSGNGILVTGSSSPQILLTANSSVSIQMTADGSAGYFGTFTNHPLNFRTNNQDRAHIDTSGRLLVGTSTSVSNLLEGALQIVGTSVDSYITATRYSSGTDAPAGIVLGRSKSATKGTNTIVASGDTLGAISFSGANGTSFDQAASIVAYVDGTPGASSDMPGRLVFSTTADGAATPTLRHLIASSGLQRAVSTTHVLEMTTTSGAGTTEWFMQGSYGGTAGSVGTGTASFRVWTNGNVVNTNNSYGAISDAKLKENIVDATSQWSDIKAFRIRKYNFKQGQTHTQLGVVANEIELISPGLVTESPDRDEEGNDLGTVTKSVNYSVLYMKAVKALQEAMERIETLEARLTAAGIA